MIKEETWKDVEGFEGIYLVSDLGNVKSLDRYVYNPKGKPIPKLGVVLKQKTTRTGYKSVHLRDKENDLESWPSVHRLLAIAFIPNPENKATVNHINGIKTDNRLENLEWATAQENTQHAFDMGLAKSKIREQARSGTENYQAKLNDDQVREIRKLRKQGLTLVKIATLYNTHFSNIGRICKRTAWGHVEDHDE